MAHYAVICEVCDKVGRPDPKRARSLPAGWRRITISNPESLRKHGVSGIVCTSGCGTKFITDNWTGGTVMAA